jgi:hypothetical protein
MHTLRNVLTALVTLLLLAGGASAQQPDISGTWKAEVQNLRPIDGKLVQSLLEMTLKIEAQDGGLIRGNKHWKKLRGQGGNVAGVDLPEANEPFIGTLESDGRTVRMVEINDYGLMFGRVIGPDKLEVSYMEPYPHAVAWTAIFQRIAE